MKKILLIPVGVFTAVVLIIAVATQRSGSGPASPPPSSAVAVSTPAASATTSQASRTQYKDGQYTGDSADASGYGLVQIRVTVSGGRISDVTFLDYPQDASHSIAINTYAMPRLQKEAVSAQSADVDIISGATATSGAFRESMQSALGQATS